MESNDPLKPYANQQLGKESRNQFNNDYLVVHVLGMYWQDADHPGYEREAKAMTAFLEVKLGYLVDTFPITSRGSQLEVESQIYRFLLRDDDPMTLHIIYYGGHGDPNDDKSEGEERQSVWSATSENESPTVDWFEIQPKLKNSQGDVLNRADAPCLWYHKCRSAVETCWAQGTELGQAERSLMLHKTTSSAAPLKFKTNIALRVMSSQEKGKHIDAFRHGYPRYAALLSSHSNFQIWRRFTRVRTRLALLKQDEIVLLEEQLDRIDREERHDLFLGCQRKDANQERRMVAQQLLSALSQYDKLLKESQDAL